MSTIDETKKWTFPDVTYLAENALNELPFISKLKEQEQTIELLNLTIETKDQEIDRLNAEISELIKKQNSLEELVKKSAENFSKALKQINTSIVSDSLVMIKAVCKKIIQHEISTNEEVLSNMLKMMTAMLGAENIITVQVSSDDYRILSKKANTFSYKLVENPELASGDLVVFTEKGGLMMKMDEAINKILRL